MVANMSSTDDYRMRGVRQLVNGVEKVEGGGVRLRRMIATPELDMVDPFVMLDQFSSSNPDDYVAGFPPHPHRGFEAVSYLLAGRVQHRDSAGHEGIHCSGGVQWMTAGRGIEHSEMPQQVDGELSGFQLWVNLPAAHKMDPPRYQEYEPEAIPVEQRDHGVTLKVITGTTAHGTVGPVKGIEADPSYFDISIPAGGEFIEPLPEGHNGFVYLIEGDLSIGESRMIPGQLAVLDDGNYLMLHAHLDSHLLLVAGRPINEPVVRGGPFVMNSEEEIRRAYADYQAGLFGHVEVPM